MTVKSKPLFSFLVAPLIPVLFVREISPIPSSMAMKLVNSNYAVFFDAMGNAVPAMAAYPAVTGADGS